MMQFSVVILLFVVPAAFIQVASGDVMLNHITKYPNAATLSVACDSTFCYATADAPAETSIARFNPVNLSIDSYLTLDASLVGAGALVVSPDGKTLQVTSPVVSSGLVYGSPTEIDRIDLGTFEVVRRQPFPLTAWPRWSSSRMIATKHGDYTFLGSDQPLGTPQNGQMFATTYLARVHNGGEQLTLVPFTVNQSMINPDSVWPYARVHAVDPAGQYVVFVLTTQPFYLVKVDIATWTVVESALIPDSPAGTSLAIGIAPTGDFLYVTSSGWTPNGLIDSMLFKVFTSNLTVADSLVVPKVHGDCMALTFDAKGVFGYFGYKDGSILKMELEPFVNVTQFSLGISGPAISVCPFGGVLSPDRSRIIWAVSKQTSNGYQPWLASHPV
eukprot:TRINITY_DN515_c1_g1_i6.p1 TRINITY_DN515_c1_g1~~TRINITY_DN515_c1_g1_i6.p1  ORF type:complete len:386 (+),score=105.58 TRINITY_DN515_c1_g1_i6:110-1267(+)